MSKYNFKILEKTVKVNIGEAVVNVKITPPQVKMSLTGNLGGSVGPQGPEPTIDANDLIAAFNNELV